MTDEFKPIHELRETLELTRLEEIRKLAARAAARSTVSSDVLASLAQVQLALTAVREEIELHEVKLGGGSERPLK